MPRKSLVLRALLTTPLLALSLGGCDALVGTDARFADSARVTISGEAAVPLLLVTSSNFTAVRDFLTSELVTTLVAADTARLTSLPFDLSVSLRGRDRFLARVVNPDVDETVTIHMQVELDDRVVFTQWASMRDASLEYTTSFRAN